jgi:hypothetical protein
MSGAPEKRKKIVLSIREREILRQLFIKTLAPVVVIILINSAVLFYGLELLMQKVALGNYGLSPGNATSSITAFVSIYVVVAVIDIMLMVLLTVISMYIVLRNVVLPIMRITREMKQGVDSKTKMTIVVRKTDSLLAPLIDIINTLFRIASF